jgi:hypothetical protein
LKTRDTFRVNTPKSFIFEEVYGRHWDVTKTSGFAWTAAKQEKKTAAAMKKA